MINLVGKAVFIRTEYGKSHFTLGQLFVLFGYFGPFYRNLIWGAQWRRKAIIIAVMPSPFSHFGVDFGSIQYSGKFNSWTVLKQRLSPENIRYRPIFCSNARSWLDYLA